MAEQRKPIMKPKSPPPPPPKPKRVATSPSGASADDGPDPGTWTNQPHGEPPKELPKILETQQLPPENKPKSPAQNKDSGTSPATQEPILFNPKRYFVKMYDPPRPPKSPKSPVAESTPKKGFFQNIYSRAVDFMTRKKTTPYENLPTASPPPAAATSTTPKQRGIFRNLFGSATPTRRGNTPESSPSSPILSDEEHSSRLDDSSLTESARPTAEEQNADVSSDVSASDLEDDAPKDEAQ